MRKLLFTLLTAAVFVACTQKQQPAVDPIYDSSDFVNITDVVPDVILEIRYYGTYNFVGTRIDGYLSPIALLTHDKVIV